MQFNDYEILARQLNAAAGLDFATPKTIKGRLDRFLKAQNLARSPYGVGNSKTESVGTYRAVGPTCPSSCSVAHMCYAKKGRVALSQARASTTRQADLVAFAAAAVLSKASGLPLRLHVSGDFYGPDDTLDLAYVEGVATIARALGGVDAWTYTHAPTAREVNYLRDLLGPVGIAVRWSDKDTHVVSEWDQVPKGGIKCPAQLSDKVSCATCRLCDRLDREIYFRAH
jgi:hypothetical protein